MQSKINCVRERYQSNPLVLDATTLEKDISIFKESLPSNDHGKSFDIEILLQVNS